MNEELNKVIKELFDLEENAVIIKSNRPDLCDYQYDGTFTLAKKLHKNPYDLGIEIADKLKEIPSTSLKFSKIECVKPGFINFSLKNDYINSLLNEMIAKPKFNITMPKSETIIIDYGGANVAKPLHVGHLRPAIVGESIKRLLKFMNQNVISDVHLGDYGLQIGQVIYGLLEENIKPNEITLEILSVLYPKISGLCKENAEIKTKCADITKELQDGNPTYQEYFKNILEISKKDIKRIYDYLGVSFDLWLGESDSYKYIPNLTKELEEQNLLEYSDGARIVSVNEETDKIEIPPFIYQKSNKAYLYGTTDLATIYERQQDYKPSKILYVADSRQSLHFTQVFRVSKKLEYTKNIDLEFLGLGTINGSDGKPFKTRAGNTPKLDQLFKETKEIFLNNEEHKEEYDESDLEKIVNAIIKFADLQNNREKEYIFDINKFSKTTGKTGPYILYTYLRTQKIIKNNESLVDKLSQNIYNEHDRNLRMKILELENNVEFAYKTRMPSILANYLYEICVLVNAFYENNHINNLEDENNKKDWVTLLYLTTKIINTLLDILVIEIPTKM
jgi:arginyl-tRNA synthetase